MRSSTGASSSCGRRGMTVGPRGSCLAGATSTCTRPSSSSSADVRTSSRSRSCSSRRSTPPAVSRQRCLSAAHRSSRRPRSTAKERGLDRVYFARRAGRGVRGCGWPTTPPAHLLFCPPRGREKTAVRRPTSSRRAVASATVGSAFRLARFPLGWLGRAHHRLDSRAVHSLAAGAGARCSGRAAALHGHRRAVELSA